MQNDEQPHIGSATPHSMFTPTREDLKRIHDICTQFENQWRTRNPFSIEQLLLESPISIRDLLLEALIRCELEQLESQGEQPNLDHFLFRFPKDSNSVRRAFLNEDQLSMIDDTVTSTFAHSRTPQPTIEDSQLKLPIPRWIGPFEILDEFARGGMGIIYRARHKTIDRIVALKVIAAGQFASHWDVARFQLEAQSIAALDHPNIVPLYEAGEWQGHHYFSMPLIEGENLAHRVQQGPLSPENAARIAKQIALAIDHAHHRGIIHRDLKPRNILLGRSDDVHISDFGLAKTVTIDGDNKPINSRAEELTLTGQVVGTPAYMAPEQAMGNPTKLSDVYSIGAVLYTMLTGNPPFQSPSPMQTLKQVLESEAVEPRRGNPNIPKDLETIVMKCLSKSQEARYASARELGEDLGRYLDGKPILARPVSRVEHFLRWTRREPVVATLAATVFAALLGGIAVALWFNSIARKNELQALKNFDFATATVKKYLSDVASSPEMKEKGLEPLRKELLSTAQEFYLQLEKNPIRSQTIDERLADSQLNLALISNELGDLDSAQLHYQNAKVAYTNLHKKYPRNFEYARVLVRCLRKRAAVHFKQNQKTEAESLFLEAVDVGRRVFSQTKSLTDQLSLASTLGELGNVYMESTRPIDEKKFYDEVERLCEELRPRLDENMLPTDAEMLIATLDSLGLNQQLHGRFADSEKWFLTIINVAERQLKLDPKNPFFQLTVARGNKNLMIIYNRLGRWAESKSCSEAAVALLEQLMREHPLVIEYIDNCALIHLNIGSYETGRQEYSKASRSFQECIRLQEDVVSRQPNNLNFRLGLGVMCSGFAKVLMQLGEFVRAEETLKKASQSLVEAQRIQADSSQAIYLSGLVSNNLGSLYRDQQRFADAEAAFQNACEQSKRLVELTPGNVDFVFQCASNYSNLSSIYTRPNQVENGIMAAMESVRLAEILLKVSPDGLEYRRLLGNSRNGLAKLYLASDQLEEAERSAKESRAISMDSIARLESGNRFQTALGIANYNLANIAMRRNQFSEALDFFEQSIAAYTIEWKLREKDGPIASRRIRELAIDAFREKVRSLWKLGRIAEALHACEAGFELGEGLDLDALRALECRIHFEQEVDLEMAAKLAEIKLEETSNLNFDGFVDIAASYAMAASSSDPARKQEFEAQMKRSLQLAFSRDPKRFANLKEDKAFAQVGDWSSFVKP